MLVIFVGIKVFSILRGRLVVEVTYKYNTTVGHIGLLSLLHSQW